MSASARRAWLAQDGHLERTSLSPATVRMTGSAAALVSFADLLAELAGVRVEAKQVERVCEIDIARVLSESQPFTKSRAPPAATLIRTRRRSPNAWGARPSGAAPHGAGRRRSLDLEPELGAVPGRDPDCRPLAREGTSQVSKVCMGDGGGPRTAGSLDNLLQVLRSRAEMESAQRCADYGALFEGSKTVIGETGDVVEFAGKTLLTPNVGRGRMEIGHRSPTRQTTPAPSSPRDYRTANPICSTNSTTSLGCAPYSLLIHSRSASSIRVCQPFPSARK